MVVAHRLLLALFATRTRLGTSVALAPRMAKDMIGGEVCGSVLKVDAGAFDDVFGGSWASEGAGQNEDRAHSIHIMSRISKSDKKADSSSSRDRLEAASWHAIFSTRARAESRRRGGDA